MLVGARERFVERYADLRAFAPDHPAFALRFAARCEQENKVAGNRLAVFDLEARAGIRDIGNDTALQLFGSERNPRRIAKLAPMGFAFVAQHLRGAPCRAVTSINV